MWSSKPPASKNYQDYSESLQKAKIQCSVLQRQKRVPAIVDFVKSGSRFTIVIPRENAKLTLVLSGIRAPRSARNANESSEPFGQEALDFANRRCLQRDVEIDVETTDKVGGFIGTLFVNRENFAKLLLEEGLASVHAYSAEQSGNATELFAAEKKAKEARKGIWHDYDPSGEDVADVSDNDPSLAPNGTSSQSPSQHQDYRDVLVTHVDPTGALKLQHISSSTTEPLTALMSAFRTFHLSPSNSSPLDSAPKAGDLVAARFSEDHEWYRARVRRNDREGRRAEVMFLDYGNSETLPWTELRPLTQPQFGLQKLKAQASDAQLSFLQFPNSKEYLADAVRFLEDRTAGKQLVARVDMTEKEGAVIWTTLFDTEDEGGVDASINAEVVAEGLATVAGRGKGRGWEKERETVLEALRKKEAEAREERRGVWEYGDLTED